MQKGFKKNIDGCAEYVISSNYLILNAIANGTPIFFAILK
jgi:hypothetical protein